MSAESEDRAPGGAAASLADGLYSEFAGVLDTTTIDWCVTDAEQLLAERGLGGDPETVRELARNRLRALTRDTVDKPAVLFLCVHNAGRSQMAAGWLQHLAGDAVEVFSGGSNPANEINQAAVAVMAEEGIDIRSRRPLPWTDEIAQAADVIITMGCGDACPVVPGTRYEDWEVRDPAGQTVEVIRQIRDEIRAHIDRLISDLGLDG